MLLLVKEEEGDDEWLKQKELADKQMMIKEAKKRKRDELRAAMGLPPLETSKKSHDKTKDNTSILPVKKNEELDKENSIPRIIPLGSKNYDITKKTKQEHG